MAIGAAGALALAGPVGAPVPPRRRRRRRREPRRDRVRRHRAAACRLGGRSRRRAAPSLSEAARTATRSRVMTRDRRSSPARVLPSAAARESRRTRAWSWPSSGSRKVAHGRNPAFSNARIEARLRTSGSATQARVAARAKTTVRDEACESTSVPRPRPDEARLAEEESRPAAPVTRVDQRGLLRDSRRARYVWMSPTSSPSDDDHVDVGRVAALDRRRDIPRPPSS